MVLYVESLEGILRDHCTLLGIIRRVCQVWEVESAVSSEQMEIGRVNLEAVRGLLRDGVREIRVGEKKG